MIRFTSQRIATFALCCASIAIPSAAHAQVQIFRVDSSTNGMVQQIGSAKRHTGKDIVALLKASGNHTVFLELAERAGYTDLLHGKTHDPAPAAISFRTDLFDSLTAGAAKTVQLSPDSINAMIKKAQEEAKAHPGDTTTHVYTMQSTTDENGKVTVQGNMPAGFDPSQMIAQIMTALKDSLPKTMNAKGDDQITVFAPTDAAFGKLPKSQLDALATDPDALVKFMRAHIVNADLEPEAFQMVGSAQALDGKMLPLKTQGKSLYVGSAKIAQPGMLADNGVAYGIETVTIP